MSGPSLEPTLWERIRLAFSVLEWRALRLRRGRCPLCEGRWLLRLGSNLLSVRCLRCQASPISMAIGQVLCDRVSDFRLRRTHEFSSRGPFFEFLARNVPQLSGSEYFDDVAPGERRGGVECQDLERLTWADDSLDLCTSTEVFEHVPDDARAFREVHRVLAPGGVLVFTVPLSDVEHTVERAVRENGEVHHLLPPEYHGDVIRGAGRVLAFRDYGRDILDRLRAAGFADAEIVLAPGVSGLAPDLPVVMAWKAGGGPSQDGAERGAG